MGDCKLGVGLAMAIEVERDKMRQNATDFEKMLVNSNVIFLGNLFCEMELWFG